MTDHTRMPAALPSADELRRRLDGELALPSRVGYTALLLAGLTVAAVAGSLLTTEPGLPARTQAAFAVIVGAGLAWAAFAAWVLARRRVLYASHRVIAAGIGVTFSALFTAGALGVWLAGSREPGALAAAAVGTTMLAAASAVLAGARRRVREITARKREIERLLAGAAR